MRTLLIGFEKQTLNGFGHLRWLEWGQNQPFNIADYNLVLLNLTTLKTNEQREKVSVVNLAHCFREEKFFEFLYNQGQLVLIGDTRLNLFNGPADMSIGGGSGATLKPVKSRFFPLS